MANPPRKKMGASKFKHHVANDHLLLQAELHLLYTPAELVPIYKFLKS
jgi:hypothetical protein